MLEGLPGKTIILGVLNLDDHAVETPEVVAERIRRALPYKGADELVAAPDCGMKYLPRDSAFGKLQSLVAGARLVRDGRLAPELRQQALASPTAATRLPLRSSSASARRAAATASSVRPPARSTRGERALRVGPDE